MTQMLLAIALRQRLGRSGRAASSGPGLAEAALRLPPHASGGSSFACLEGFRTDSLRQSAKLPATENSLRSSQGRELPEFQEQDASRGGSEHARHFAHEHQHESRDVSADYESEWPSHRSAARGRTLQAQLEGLCLC